MKRLISAAALALLAACSTAPQPVVAPPQPVHLVIVGTTDVHGWFNGRTDTAKGGTTVRSGGLAVLAGYVNTLREENPGRVVLVDSGDLFQGTLESNLFEGEPVVRAYNQLGYAAAAVGNHEFDYGPLGPDSVVLKPGEDPLGALKHNAEMAKFPFLSANLVDKTTGQTPSWAKKSTIVAVSGVKLGIIGLSTPDTPNTTVASNVASLAFSDPVKAALDEAAHLRAEGADAVIVIAHMGGRCGDMNDVHDVASCETEHEAMRFLGALPGGAIDAYFAGHTHAQMRQIINGVPAVQAAPFSQAFSTIDLWVDPAAHRTLVEKSAVRPHTNICSAVWSGTDNCDARRAPAGAQLVARVFDGKPLQADPSVASLLQPYLDRTAAKKNEATGIKTAARFTRAYRRESPLGDLIADALREAAHADAGFMNSGGIRSDLREGDITYGDVFEVSPFDNTIAVVTLTGAQIAEALNLTTNGERGILQVSGFRYAVDGSKPAGSRVTAVTLPDGQVLDPKASYRVAMPDFLAQGGDGLAPLMNRLPSDRFVFDQSRPLRDVVAQTAAKWPMPLAPKPLDRITITNAPGEE